MSHLHLPVKHTDDDLALAGALASILRSSELYVAWSLEAGPSEPVVAAAIMDPEAPRKRGLLARLLGRG